MVLLVVTTGVTEATCTAIPLSTPLEETIAVRFPALGLVEKVTVKAVAVAAATDPIAPLLNVTKLLATDVLKPVPAMVMVVAVAARLVVFAVTTGAETFATTCATWTADPLVRVFEVTIAVKLPVAVGLVVSEIASELTEAAKTVPMAPPLNATVLLAITGLKPNPLITRLVPLSARLNALFVTTGSIAATCTAVPLLTPFVVTIAVMAPAIGFVVYVTVSEVRVAALTVPIAPLLRTTVLLPAVVLKPEPPMVSVWLAGEPIVLADTTGFTVAT